MLIHVRIYGRVQGVGFRAWARQTAQAYHLSGWVRNRINGSVEILAQGESLQADAFLMACRRGPLFGHVDRIEPVSIPDAPILPVQQGIFTIEATV